MKLASKCRLDANVSNNKFTDKRICNKGLIWNHSNGKCECHKSCNFGDIQIMKIARAEKKLFDKLV